MSGIKLREIKVKENRSFQVTLPKVFAAESGIKPGDDIELIQTVDGRLVLQPKGWKPAPNGASA